MQATTIMQTTSTALIIVECTMYGSRATILIIRCKFSNDSRRPRPLSHYLVGEFDCFLPTTNETFTICSEYKKEPQTRHPSRKRTLNLPNNIIPILTGYVPVDQKAQTLADFGIWEILTSRLVLSLFIVSFPWKIFYPII
jgi:hypothetical protein